MRRRRRTGKQRQQGGWGGLQSVWCKREREGGIVEERRRRADEADRVLEVWWTCEFHVWSEPTVKVTGEFGLHWNSLWFTVLRESSPGVDLRRCWTRYERCQNIQLSKQLKLLPAHLIPVLVSRWLLEALCEASAGSEKVRRRNSYLQMASRWWDHDDLLSSPPGSSWYDSHRDLPDYYLSLKPSWAQPRYSLQLLLFAIIVKATDKERFSPHSFCRGSKKKKNPTPAILSIQVVLPQSSL